MTAAEVLPKIDVSKYLGEWVVICDSEIIAHSKNITEVQAEIEKCKKTPTIAKIPKQEILIF